MVPFRVKGTTEQVDIAGCRFDQGEEHPDGGAFSGAVGAKESENIAAVDFKVQIANGPPLSVPFAQVGCLKDDVS